MESDTPGSQPEAIDSPCQQSVLPPADIDENQVAALLQCRFGDGMDYFPRRVAAHLLEVAVRLGFVDEEGYLTRRGRSLLARHHFA